MKMIEDLAIINGEVDDAPPTPGALLANVVHTIEQHKQHVFDSANAKIVLMLWEVGRHINTALLGNKRAEYGKQIVTTLSRQLVVRYGATFNLSGLKRMRKFAVIVGETEIGATPWHQLSWSHIERRKKFPVTRVSRMIQPFVELDPDEE
jgi:hypothetical protein